MLIKNKTLHLCVYLGYLQGLLFMVLHVYGDS